MNRIIKYLCLGIFCLFAASTTANAAVATSYVNLETMELSTNGKDYEPIKEYSRLADFLSDYDSNQLDDVYITDFLFDGVSAVQSPDLDDFIKADSNDIVIKTLEIKVLNINNLGTYELSGKTKGTMVGVNTNNLKGDIDINLNNAEIDTDSKKAPVIYVYNKDINYTDCKVTINALKDTRNYLEGGKLKKVSLVPSDDLHSYSSNYSNDSLDHYNKFTAYYGIYTSEEIENILFATVRADNEGLMDGDPYYFYKASGAISSDIDLYFEGEGFLRVTSKNKEGIETKGNLSLVGGTGDYEVSAQDDCLNTTTANSAGTNVRNALTIDVGSLLAIVSNDGDEGDAIDSNGTLTINGGKIYAFAHASSQDSGLDSEDGIYLNGGTIIATGNMSDRIAEDSKQEYIYLNFGSKISAGTLIVVKNQKNEIVVAFEANSDFTTLLFSDSDLDYESLKVYANGNIKGSATNGVYTEIEAYDGGEEITFAFAEMGGAFNKTDTKVSSVLGYALLVEVLLLIVLLASSKLVLSKQ